MPPKVKKDLDENELPQIDRTIVKVRLLGASTAALAEAKTRIAKTKRKDVVMITRDRVMEWAEANSLYINPDNWDPKKKMPEGVPTVMTPDFKIELYKKYIKEQDIQGRLHAVSVQEAEKAGKEKPTDPRFIEDPKKAQKKEPPKKKDPKAPEEVEEKELEEKPHEKKFDYLYILLDDFETESELSHLEDLQGLVLLTVRTRNVEEKIKEAGIPPETILGNQIRDSQAFVKDLRKRLDDFVDQANSLQEAPLEEDVGEREAIENEMYQRYIRENLSKKNVWSWHALYMEFDAALSRQKDPVVHWGFYLREAIFELAMKDSIEWRNYFDWVGNLQLTKVTVDPPILYSKLQEVKAAQEKLRKEKEEAARIAEEEKNKKTQKAPPKQPEKKDPKKDKDKAAEKPLEKVPDKVAEKPAEPTQTKEKKVRQPHAEWRLFEVMEKQLNELPLDSICPGVLLEVFCDEIQTRYSGGMSSQIPSSQDSDQYIAPWLDSMLAILLKDKIIDEKQIQLAPELANNETSRNTKYKSVCYEEDKSKCKYRDLMLHNKDKIFLREGLLLKYLTLPVISSFMHALSQATRDLIKESIRFTEERAKIESNLFEFERLQNIVQFEQMFNNQVGMIDWNFKNRSIVEQLNPSEFSQWLAKHVQHEPEIITSINPQTGGLYIGLYFKSPPGRVLYRRWEGEKNAIPSFKTFQQLADKTTSKSYFNLAEDQFGVLSERRTLLMPSDCIRADIRVSTVAFKEISRVLVYKRDLVLGLKAPVEVDDVALKDIIKRETMTLRQPKTESSKKSEAEEGSSETGRAEELNNLTELQIDTIEEVQNIDKLFEDAKKHYTTAGELFIEFDKYRVLFETSYVRLDIEDLEMEKKLCIGKELKSARFLSSMTIHKPDGRKIKVDGNGNVIFVAKQVEHIRSGRYFEAIGVSLHRAQEEDEVHRMVSGRGIVTRYFADGTFHIYYPSGRVDISTKGEHFFSRLPDGTELLLEPRTGSKKVVDRTIVDKALDPDTGIRFLAKKKDNISRFIYPDGSRLVIFGDGTSIHSNPERSTFIVKHQLHPEVEINYDYFRARNPGIIGVGSAFATKGKENLFDRTYTGRICKVKLMSGTELSIFKEMRELEGYNNFKLFTVSILRTPDDKVIKLENYGEIVLVDQRDFLSGAQVEQSLRKSISSLGRRPNELQNGKVIKPSNFQRVNPDPQVDYFLQLFLPRVERAGSVVSADLNQGEIYLKDPDSNEFTLNRDGRVRSKISVSFNLNSQAPKWDPRPNFTSAEYIDPLNTDLPVPKEWQPPQLAIVDNQGRATIFYEPPMLADYFLNKLYQQSFVVEKRNQATGTKGLSIVTLDQPTTAESISEIYKLPSAFRGLPSTKALPEQPIQRSLTIRSFEESTSFKPDDPKSLAHTDLLINQWRQKRQKEAEDRKIYFPSTEEKYTELEFQQKMLVLEREGKNTIVYGESNKNEISNPSNVKFMEA